MSFLVELRTRARARPRVLVFPEGEDSRVAEAIAEIQRSEIAIPVPIGSPDEILRGVKRAGGRPDELRVVDSRRLADEDRYVAELLALRGDRGLGEDEARERVRDPLVLGALMVGLGEADGSVAGAVRSTADVVRSGLWCVGLAEGIHVVSSSFYMVTPPFRGDATEVLTFTDAGVVPEPDAVQLAEIALAASRARRSVVGDEPRVAFLSFSTRGSAAGEPVRKMQEALAHFRRLAPDVAADGELQGDAALIADVADRKAPGSAVAGRANVLVFPDLDAGNIAYKLVQRIAKAVAIGPIVQGLRRPCNDLSRGAVADDVLNVACVTSLMAD